jgi:hypothetical protein
MFLTIHDAYNKLSDPLIRRKYDAGLVFEARGQAARREARVFALPERYRAPLRCGMVVAEALPRLGRWELTKILQWDDITDGAGKVMVASWSVEEERIKVNWVSV